MQQMIANTVASFVGMMITEEMLEKFKADFLASMEKKALATNSKVDDELVRLLKSGAADELFRQFQISIVRKADELAKSTDTRFDDTLVDVLQKVTKVTDEDLVAA